MFKISDTLTGSISQKVLGFRVRVNQSRTTKNKQLSVKNARSLQRADVSVCEGIKEFYTWLQFCIEFFYKPAIKSGDKNTRDWSHEDASRLALDTQEGSGKKHVTEVPHHVNET